VVRHHLGEAVVEVAAAVEGEVVHVQCHSVGVHAEGQVFQAVAVAEGVAEGQVQLADQWEEGEGEAVQLVQRKSGAKVVRVVREAGLLEHVRVGVERVGAAEGQLA
jgi:hypothetical protein